MDYLLDLARSLLDSPWLLILVLGLTIVDCLVPSVPSDEVIIAVAALAVSSGDAAMLPGLLAVAVVGAVIGDSLVFGAGSKLPRQRLERWPRLTRMLAAADRQFNRRGARLVITARFIPVVRIGVTLVAGGALHYRRWLPMGIAACLLWAGVTVGIGSLAGLGFSDRPLLAMLVGIVVGILVGLGIDRVISSRADPGGETQP